MLKMDNSKDDSEAPVFTLPYPPKRRVPIMTYGQIFDKLTYDLTRFWEKTRIITAEDVNSKSKEKVELSFRTFKHYQNGLHFNYQIYRRFFEESDDNVHIGLSEEFGYFKKFLTSQIGLLESYVKILSKIEGKRALKEERRRISKEIQRSIRSLRNL
ncbi:UNVERIFIED_CONTAM: hypothetical protein RMT77_006661 [Armadillidium vulgare]